MASQQPGVGEEVTRGAVRHNPAPIQDHTPAAQLERKRQVVGDDQLSEGQRLQDPNDLSSSRGVECPTRLIEHQDVRFHGEHCCQCGAATLSAAQMMGSAVGEVGSLHGLQRLPSARGESVPGEPQIRRPERNILTNRRHEELVICVLEYKAHPASDFPERVLCYHRIADPNRAGASRENPVQMQRQRGLPGAVRSQQSNPLAVVDLKIHSAQCLAPVRVAILDAIELDGGRRHVRTQAKAAIIPTSTRNPAAMAHCLLVAFGSSKLGMTPENPRDTIAACTRSPRS